MAANCDGKTSGHFTLKLGLYCVLAASAIAAYFVIRDRLSLASSTKPTPTTAGITQSPQKAGQVRGTVLLFGKAEKGSRVALFPGRIAGAAVIASQKKLQGGFEQTIKELQKFIAALDEPRAQRLQSKLAELELELAKISRPFSVGPDGMVQMKDAYDRLNIRTMESLFPDAIVNTSIAADDGSFSFEAVPAGEYMISANVSESSFRYSWFVSLEVNQIDVGVSLSEANALKLSLHK